MVLILAAKDAENVTFKESDKNCRSFNQQEESFLLTFEFTI